MKTEISRIRDQYLRAVSGESWPSDDLDTVLADIPADLAERRVLPHGKTIHELVQHLVYTERTVTKRLQGHTTPWDYDAAWADPVALGHSWADTLAELQETRQAFLATLGQITDEQLDMPPAPGQTSAYLNLHGLIQHLFYHLGQISMLRSLLRGQ